MAGRFPPLIPKTSVYGEGAGKLPPAGLLIARGIASVFILASAPIVVFLPRKHDLMWLVLCGWLIGPPIWFAIEYFFIYKRYGSEVDLEEFKYGQEVMTRLWAGVAAALVAYIVR